MQIEYALCRVDVRVYLVGGEERGEESGNRSLLFTGLFKKVRAFVPEKASSRIEV